jgi:hypothetical protein
MVFQQKHCIIGVEKTGMKAPVSFPNRAPDASKPVLQLNAAAQLQKQLPTNPFELMRQLRKLEGEYAVQPVVTTDSTRELLKTKREAQERAAMRREDYTDTPEGKRRAQAAKDRNQMCVLLL